MGCAMENANHTSPMAQQLLRIRVEFITSFHPETHDRHSEPFDRTCRRGVRLPSAVSSGRTEAHSKSSGRVAQDKLREESPNNPLNKRFFVALLLRMTTEKLLSE